MADNHRKKDAGVASTCHGSITEQVAVMAPRDEAFQPEKTVAVLAISPIEDDHLFLGNIFGHTNWQLRKARTWREALSLLDRQRIPVLICESQLLDATWKDVLAELSNLPDQPMLIVASRLADESFWAEVLNLGAYDVLMKPFDATEVFRVVSLAWMNWKNDHERIGARAALAPEYARAVGL